MPSEEKLSRQEVARLAELEDTIKNAETNREQALLEIHDSKLYREYGTFEQYCLLRWAVGASRAHQLLDHARNSTMVDVQNERQTRELKRLTPRQAKQVLEKAAGSDGKLTAARIKQARAEVVKVEPVKQHRASPEERERRADQAVDLWQQGYHRFDICGALGISERTLWSDLTGHDATRRPVAGLKPPGHPLPEIEEWRDQSEQAEPNVIRLTLVPGKAACDLDRESADRYINNADAGTDHLAQYVKNGYELTESQVERLVMIRDRVDRLIREAAEQKGVG